jgi:tRNA (guanine37-N1)-methyltransferase
MNADSNDVIIRPARPGEEDGILRCLAAAFEPYHAAYTPEAFTDTTLTPASLALRLREMHVLVAVTREETVGTIAGSVRGIEGHLRGMAVVPAWQGSGLAAKLLRAIEAWLEANACSRVTLDTTLPLGPAMKFYEKNGYRRSGRVTDFFGMALVEYVKEL